MRALWVGTLGGPERSYDQDAYQLHDADGFSDNVVISIYGDGEGRLWIGTNGGGLNLMRRTGSFTALHHARRAPERRHLPHPRGRARQPLDELQQGHLPPCQVGSSTTSPAGRAHALNPVVYGTADGMTTRECSGGGHPSAWRGGDGRLWFSTIKGVAMIDPERWRANEQPPPVVVEQVALRRRAAGDRGRRTSRPLPPGTSRFDFPTRASASSRPRRSGIVTSSKGLTRTGSRAATDARPTTRTSPPGDYTLPGRRLQQRRRLEHDARPFRLHPSAALLPNATGSTRLCVAGPRVARRGSCTSFACGRCGARFAAVLSERNRIAREIARQPRAGDSGHLRAAGDS